MTSREMYFNLFDQGLDNEEVAERLAVGKATVKNYRTEWYSDRGLKNAIRTGKEIAFDMMSRGIMDYKQIAAEAGISVQTAAGYKHAFVKGAMTSPRKEPEKVINDDMTEKEKCLALFDAKYTPAQASRALNIEYSTAKKYREYWLAHRWYNKPGPKKKNLRKDTMQTNISAGHAFTAAS